MASRESVRRRHFLLHDVTKPEPFEGRSGGSPSVTPPQPRPAQAQMLRTQLATVADEMATAKSQQVAAGVSLGFGLQIEFASFPGIEKFAVDQLSPEGARFELLNVRVDGTATLATVFVPDGQLVHFERKIADYESRKTDKNGRPLDNQKLVDAINSIRTATLAALWTDEPSLMPSEGAEVIVWEIWLAVRDDRNATTAEFKNLALAAGIHVAEGSLSFPERTVVLARASKDQLSLSMMTLNCIAELRRAKITAERIGGLTPAEEPEWVMELWQRSTFVATGVDCPYVCILDTGVSRGHALLAPALDAADLHGLEPAFGVGDDDGHGTGMAGVAVFGDLDPLLSGSSRVEVQHRLESVKLFEGSVGNFGSPKHHGYLTVEAVARPEIAAAQRRRVFSMALSSPDARDRGRPSAWSAALDRLAADVDGDGASPRLFVICAGNVRDWEAWCLYPESNTSDGCHDPAQAWNALTVGAYTEKTVILEPAAEDYRAIAVQGGLSPFSTTSATWHGAWPLKPDVLFEGGNAGKDSLFATWFQSLSLVTANFRPTDRWLSTTNATSAATALAAKMAAELMVTYPTAWPETIRALIVHSARWTPAMLTMFLPRGAASNKGDYLRLVRHCGFGVPDPVAAHWTMRNSLTLVVEQSLQPFQRTSGEPKMREMRLHTLPWPAVALAALGETEVEMRVTLSYFIEPNPSARGFAAKHRYHSHGLRFEVRRPTENELAFRRRINVAAHDEDDGVLRTSGDDPGWKIGAQGRTKGSIHSDIWCGTAVELAARGQLAVYPTGGWWKYRKKHNRFDNAARYALVVSIVAPEIDVDLITEVAIEVGEEIEIGV